MNMYKHIILFRFMDSVPGSDVIRALDELGRLKIQIPEIQDYCYGKNDINNVDSQNYEYAFVMTFKSKKDRYIYQNHPAHVALVDSMINPIVADAVVFDMEDCRVSREIEFHV